MDLRNINTEDPTTPPESELVPREVRLNVAYVAPDGSKYDETLISRIPDGERRTLIDRRAAILAGVAWAQLSEYAQARFLALASISVYIVNMPDWLNKWAQEDDDLLFAIREEVERHAFAWFRGSLRESGEDENTSRVHISSTHASLTAF